MDAHFIAFENIRLHVVEAGDPKNPTIIFLHGFPEFWYCWKHQIDFFVEQGYHVVVPDQRGYNKSEKPKGIKNYQIDTLAQDVENLVKHYHKEKVFIVGHDWGAAVAWHFGISRPHLLEKLIILNVPHPYTMRDTLKKSGKQRKNSWYMLAFQVPRLPEVMMRARRFRVLRNSLNKTSREGSFSKEDMDKYCEAWQKEKAINRMVNWYRAAIKYPQRYDGVPMVNVPVKIIWGTQDAFLITEMAEASLEYCLNGNVHHIDTAGHWLQHEEPEIVNNSILEFIQN